MDVSNPCKTVNGKLNLLSKNFYFYLPKYVNIILLEDFNSKVREPSISEFCNIYNFKNLMKEPTWFKNQVNSSCIGMILTNRYRCFQNTLNIETGPPDCHKMTLTVLKTKVQKGLSKDCLIEKFTNEDFMSDLIANVRFIDTDNIAYDVFDDIFMALLDKHAPPIKLKYIGRSIYE